MVEPVNEFYEVRLRKRLDLVYAIHKAMGEAGLDYRLTGGWTCFFYVEQNLPDAGRLDPVVEVVVRGHDLAAAASIVEGLPDRRLARIIPREAEQLGPFVELRGLRLLPALSLVEELLARYRVVDQMRIVDLDEAGVITPEVENALTPVLLQRLLAARARG